VSIDAFPHIPGIGTHRQRDIPTSFGKRAFDELAFTGSTADSRVLATSTVARNGGHFDRKPMLTNVQGEITLATLFRGRVDHSGAVPHLLDEGGGDSLFWPHDAF
jgi:hypothetical protein